MVSIEDTLPRKLTAILMADVVGYSRLMGRDESGTLALLNAHRKELIDPTIAVHHGRIVKLMGDGALVEFPSVLEAVSCALEIQEGMARRNKDIPDSEQIKFRIGVNLSDVIVEGDDILGDGVNITARLETLAKPGGVCISGMVFDAVGNKLPLEFEFLGEQHVKNISHPVRAYSVRIKLGASLPAMRSNKKKPTNKRLLVFAGAIMFLITVTGIITLFQSKTERNETTPIEQSKIPDSGKPSIAVLPFDNMSGDPEHEYFSDGISEDIITDLSGLSNLAVISRNSSFT